MKWMKIVVVALVALGIVADAQAYLHAYEGFKGALGNGAPLDGAGGGSGLQGTWNVASSPGGAGDNVQSIDRTVGPLGFPKNIIFSPSEKPGNNFQWWEYASWGPAGSIWSRTPGTRTMQKPIDFGKDDTYYMSFLGRTHGGSDSYLTVGMRESGSNESVNVGWVWNSAGLEPFQINTNTNADGFGPGGTVVTGPDGMTENATYFFVAQIQTSAAGNDVISLKAYDTATETVHRRPSDISGVGSGANQWDVQMTLTSSAVLNQLMLAANGAGFPNADEIRFGDSWTDVTGLHERDAKYYESIGFNFVGGQGGGVLAPGEVAGSPNTIQANWNNLATDWHGNAGAVPATVVENTGVVVGTNNDASLGLRIQYDSGTVWGTGIGSTTPDQRLMRGYLDDAGVGSSQPYIELFNIPYERYDIVLYVDGDQADGTDGPYWIEQLDGTIITPQVYVHDFVLGSSHFDGKYTQVPLWSTLGDLFTGNFMIFENLTLSDIRIRATQAPGTRAPINAFQIMERIPEPGTMTLLGLGSVVALIRRRRRRA